MSTTTDLPPPLRLKTDLPFRRPFGRPVMGTLPYSLAVTAFIMAADNHTFWQRSMEVFDGNLLQVAGWGSAVAMLTLLTLQLPGFRWLLRPMAAFLLILAAITSYFMDRLGIIIDREMIQNAMLTTMSESKHLVTWNFVAHVILWGVLPAAVALWVRVRRGAWLADTLRWMLTIAVTLAVFAGLLFSDFKAYSAVAREHKEVLASYQPGAAISGAARYAKMMLKAKNVTVTPVGLDAHKGQQIGALTKPVLTVVFVGETARAQNFSINGYGRPTTPELERRGVINFPHVTSCGTSTAVSVPCMMSNLGRDGYSYNRSIRQENLIDVLHHADVDVLWWDNNTGDQGVAARITKARRMTAADDPEACTSGECTDAVFLGPLRQALPAITRDTVLFVHMIGSHGPSYYLRYPPSAEHFAPACRTAEFADCSVEEIVNAYDNSIRFTDDVIARTIDLLSAQTHVVPAVLYLSDHGESLGEDGLYLHAAPYFMAPATQTTVPMMMWLPESYASGLAVQRDCVEAKAALAHSHDNLFHTVLGLMDIETAARDPALDLIGACR